MTEQVWYDFINTKSLSFLSFKKYLSNKGVDLGIFDAKKTLT